MKEVGRLVRFGLVGVLNTGVYYVGYLVLNATAPYLVAHLVATAVAMVISYFLNCYITFRQPPRLHTFLLFPLSNVANVAITMAGLPIAVHWIGVDENVAPLPVALLAIPITYVVARVVMMGRSLRSVRTAAVGHGAGSRPETLPGHLLRSASPGC